MRPGREMDARIAKEVLGYNVLTKDDVLYEAVPSGDRPLRNYTSEMASAWEVAEHMKVTLFPIAGGQWFAFVGPKDLQGWESPEAMLQFLASGKFDECGASVGDSAPVVICEAALRAAEKRRALEAVALTPVSEETQHTH